MVSRGLYQVYPFASSHVTTSFFHTHSTEQSWSYVLPMKGEAGNAEEEWILLNHTTTDMHFPLHKEWWAQETVRKNK